MTVEEGEERLIEYLLKDGIKIDRFFIYKIFQMIEFLRKYDLDIKYTYTSPSFFGFVFNGYHHLSTYVDLTNGDFIIFHKSETPIRTEILLTKEVKGLFCRYR